MSPHGKRPMTAPSWTQAVADYLLASPPEGKDLQAIERLLCTPWDHIFPPENETVLALRKWLRKSPTLSLQYALSSALPFTDDLRRLAGPLMCWAFATQPWREIIQVKSVVSQWGDVLDEPNLYSDGLAANMAVSTRLLLNAVPAMAPEQAETAVTLWATMFLNHNTLLWKPGMYTAAPRAQVLAAWSDLYALGAIAYGPNCIQLWQACVQKAFDGMPAGQSEAIVALTNSALPDDAKVHAACCAHAKHWLDPTVRAQLLPVFMRTVPSQEYRLHLLPWTTRNSHSVIDEQYADTNRRLCEAYCPELIAVFALYPVDWKDRVSVLKLAEKHGTCEPVAPISLDGLLDSSPM